MIGDRGDQARRMPLAAPTMATMPLPDTRLLTSVDRGKRFRGLIDEVKKRATSLPPDPKAMAHATADRLVDAWYPFHPERVELHVELFMFAGHGAAAKVVEVERFGTELRLIAVPIHSVLAAMYWGIADMADSDSKGVEPTTWKRRNGYALLAGYYAARVQGTEVLDLIVANTEDD